MIEVGQGLERIGFELRQQIIWAKTQAAMSRSAYNWQHEPCWYAVRKGKTASWRGSHSDTTLWEMASPKMIMGGSTEQKYDHPTQKPVEAMSRAIGHHAGDVYEPFSGSGTTLVAAETLSALLCDGDRSSLRPGRSGEMADLHRPTSDPRGGRRVSGPPRAWGR